MNNGFSVDIVSWTDYTDQLNEIRYQVFVVEQKVPQEIEVDVNDIHNIHARAFNESGETIGTGRIANDKIGRMAVLQSWRNRGVGSAILEALMQQAKTMGLVEVTLNAQVEAYAFYQHHGFSRCGEVFEEAGIKHIKMQCLLT